MVKLGFGYQQQGVGGAVSEELLPYLVPCLIDTSTTTKVWEMADLAQLQISPQRQNTEKGGRNRKPTQNLPQVVTVELTLTDNWRSVVQNADKNDT